MAEDETISWIFLATAMASQVDPTNFEGIEQMADGINHAIPTQKKIRNSITILIKRDLVQKMPGKKYLLSDKGKLVYEHVSEETNLLLKIWKNLENKFKEL